MLYEKLYDDVSYYVNSSDFKSGIGLRQEVKVQFLAQGEYNLNYLLETGGDKYVLRINTASQMQLNNQIAYEYQALQLLSRSMVTPRPFFMDDSLKEIPYGLLVMEYLPGDPLDYRYDLEGAAQTFAQIHGQEIHDSETDFLIKECGPLSGIYDEASRLLDKYFGCPESSPEVRDMMEKVLLKAGDKKKEEDFLLQEPWLAVINTEVNSHNFIVNRTAGTCHLIDWEKPIYGETAQDLSMFLIATTTMWKRNYTLSRSEEDRFLKQYTRYLPNCLYKDSLRDRVQMFKFFNYLRAISWCAMAWTEYIKPGRPLVNRDTFEKIIAYLEPDFIKDSFPEVF